MSTNTLKALLNIISNPITKIKRLYVNKNRANSVGDSLELYIKDCFANTLQLNDRGQIDVEYSKFFSYLGNTNNPPDFIISKGDAVEIKKTESVASSLALNSSHPKNKFYSNDTKITNECKHCEDNFGGWQEKDILYTIGNIQNENLKNLWFVYGSLYAANRDTYEKVSDKIKQGVRELKDIELTNTNEIAKINKVDPLGITYLRVRGMWGIENPVNVFSSIVKPEITNLFNLIALIPIDKYDSFPEVDRVNLEKSKARITNVKVKNPNNPANLIDAKLITFSI